MQGEDRTEQATPERKRESRKKGQVAKSPELNSAISLLVGLYFIKSFATDGFKHLSTLMTHSLGNLNAFPQTPDGVHTLFLQTAADFFRIIGPLLIGMMFIGVVTNVGQVGLMFSNHLLKPDFTRLDPMKGIQRMVSPKSLIELGKNLGKMAVLGWVVSSYLKNEQSTMVTLGMMERSDAGKVAGNLIWGLCIRSCSVLLLFSAMDYLYQRFQFEKSQKMTKQEVKEEYKKSEGDPHMKAKFKQRHRQLASQRMMQDVPTADVIVTNPTHYAVALKYDGETMAAPMVIAMGKDFVAQRIKEMAKEHKIPVVENKPVARALYASAKIGAPIPLEMYQAVAEILAFVYRLKHGARTRR